MAEISLLPANVRVAAIRRPVPMAIGAIDRTIDTIDSTHGVKIFSLVFQINSSSACRTRATTNTRTSSAGCTALLLLVSCSAVVVPQAPALLLAFNPRYY